MFPFASTFFPHLLHARETIAAAMTEYMRKDGHESASGLVRLRHEHHHKLFGLKLEDIARGELGNSFAVLGNTTPCAFWLIYHIYSDNRVLSDIRRELAALVTEQQGQEDGMTYSFNLADIRTSCPILLSTFQEMLRFRAVNPGPRVLLEDVHLDGQYLLKKGSMLMIPATVQHSDTMAWGENVGKFDHLRFIRKPGTSHRKPNRVAFRAFGGGHILCPGRHFASIEIMAFAALLVLQFDIAPIQGKWIEPICNNTPAQSGFPVPDKELGIELRARDAYQKWNFSFLGSDKAMDIVTEDCSMSN